MSQEKTQTGSGSGFNFALLVCLLVAGFFIYSLMNLGSIEGRGGLAVGKPAPEIQAAGWVNGSPPDVLSGKVIVVDAWATWCLPCKKKAPDLVETYQKFADRDDVVFIGLTAETEAALPAIQNFLDDTKIPWPNGYGAMETLRQLEAEYIPSVWVINRDGEIAWNYDSAGDLEQAIRAEL